MCLQRLSLGIHNIGFIHDYLRNDVRRTLHYVCWSECEISTLLIYVRGIEDERTARAGHRPAALTCIARLDECSLFASIVASPHLAFHHLWVPFLRANVCRTGHLQSRSSRGLDAFTHADGAFTASGIEPSCRNRVRSAVTADHHPCIAGDLRHDGLHRCRRSPIS